MVDDGDDTAPGRIAGSDRAREWDATSGDGVGDADDADGHGEGFGDADDADGHGDGDGGNDAGDGGGGEEDGEPGPASDAATGEARVSTALDLRAVLVRSSGYALLAAAVAFTIHTAGTVRGLGHPDPTAAVAVNVARSAGTFAVAYPIVMALNTVGRRLGATRVVAARTASPTVLWAVTTVVLTVALFLPVIRAILAGTPY